MKEIQPDTCSFCRGKLQQKETEFVARVNDKVIVIKDIPAHVCENCDEAYFEPDTSRKIDVIMQQFHENKLLTRPLAAGEVSLNSGIAQVNEP